jgi:hypothetical protein
MTAILRFVGILNAAIWLGGSVYFTFVAGTMPFSAEMNGLLRGYYPYYSGAIAQIGIARFFTFQLVCGIVALAHLAAEWLYQERRGRKVLLWLLGAMVGLIMLGDFWLQPKMNRLHDIKYARNYPAAQREAADRSFRVWHSLTMTMNCFMLGGMVVYLLHMSRPPETARFVRPAPRTDGLKGLGGF